MPNTEMHQEIDGTFYSFDEAQIPLLEELSSRVQEMRNSGDLSPRTLAQIRKFFRLKNIYHSNAIEGNILEIGETRQVVEQGLTLTGKPLKDQAEAKNLNEALDFLEDLASSADRPISEADIRQIHHFVLKGIHDENAGNYRLRPVEISGSAYKPPPPEEVAPQMQELGQWLSSISKVNHKHGVLEAILYAAAAHTWFVYIHPFIDGNGRTARLLMNLILMRYSYPIAIITKADRLRYYDALEDSQSSDLSAFLALVTECINESLEEYEEALKIQTEEQEFYASIAKSLSTKEEVRAKNEYEVWKNAMELLRSYFRQATELLHNQTIGSVRFRDFGTLEFEKYLSLRQGESAKRTWFFRIDFESGEQSARYLFFFGWPHYSLRETTDVTLHLSREEPPKSFNYEHLDSPRISKTPQMVEIGYHTHLESFTMRLKSGPVKQEKLEQIGRKFFAEVSKIHF